MYWFDRELSVWYCWFFHITFTVFMFVISYDIMLEYPFTRWRVFQIQITNLNRMMRILFWRIFVVCIKFNYYHYIYIYVFFLITSKYSLSLFKHYTISPSTISPLQNCTILPVTVQYLILRWNPCFLRQYSVLPEVLHAVPHVVLRGGVSYHVWLGGICSLVGIVTPACSLTC